MLSVICPCYNEGEVIGLFYEELKKTLNALERIEHEILFVDDGSTDDTLEKLNAIAEEDGSVKVCALSRNFGHQIALTAGLDYASGEAVIMMDTDLQHPPSLIPEMVAKWREGYDIVSAVRKGSQGRFKDWTARGFYSFLNKTSGTHVPPDAADFCLLAPPVRESLQHMRERHRFIRGMISWTGFNRTFLPYEVGERAAGESKYNVFKMQNMAFDAIFSFSAAPLRLATRVGLLVTAGGFAYLLWILIRMFVFKDLIPGWTSLIAVTLILGGCQLLFIGIIGQYVARVFEEVKGRPLYLVKQVPTGARPAGFRGGSKD